MQIIIGDGEFLAWDNSTPPQLWVWAGARDESAEPIRRLEVPAVPGLQELREDLKLKTKQLHRIRDILSFSSGNNGEKIEAIGKVVPAILCGEPDITNHVDELTIRTAIAALEIAADDMAEWRQLARRQYEEMPHNAAICPTSAGIENSEERSRIVSRAIGLCRERIQADDKSEAWATVR